MIILLLFYAIELFLVQNVSNADVFDLFLVNELLNRTANLLLTELLLRRRNLFCFQKVVFDSGDAYGSLCNFVNALNKRNVSLHRSGWTSHNGSG